MIWCWPRNGLMFTLIDHAQKGILNIIKCKLLKKIYNAHFRKKAIGIFKNNLFLSQYFIGVIDELWK